MTVILKDIFTPVFVVALFAIIKIWKQLKCTHTHTKIFLNFKKGKTYCHLQQHGWSGGHYVK